MPQISPDILSVARSRHECGLMSPWVYHILSEASFIMLNMIVYLLTYYFQLFCHHKYDYNLPGHIILGYDSYTTGIRISTFN